MQATPIICRPTPWFFWRVSLIIVMLLGFGLYFLYDYQIGYPEKNRRFFIYKMFVDAHGEFVTKRAEGLSASEWADYAAKASSKLGDADHPVPADSENPMSWPAELQDADLLESGPGPTWQSYTGRVGWPAKPPSKEDLKNNGKVREQLISGVIALSLSVIPLFLLIRTSRRSIRLENGELTGADGTRIRLEEIKRVDLRKWKNKGLARIEFESGDKSGSLRIDGLTYGGFKKENGEPAEKLMNFITENFDGEIVEYEEDIEEEAQPAAKDGDTSTSES